MSFARRASGVLGLLLAAGALAACGEATVGSGGKTTSTSAARAATSDPEKATTGDSGNGATADPPAGSTGVAADPKTGGDSNAAAKEVADPLESDSYPAPASVKHASAATPTKA